MSMRTWLRGTCVLLLALHLDACGGEAASTTHDAGRDAGMHADGAADDVDSGMPTTGHATLDSEALIEAALAKGTLDVDTALRYRVFAAFGDARLPEAYRSDVPPIGGTRAIGELVARFGALSAANQKLLRPFLIPPDQPDSWYALRKPAKSQAKPQAAVSGVPAAAFAPLTETWDGHRAAGGLATVWSQGAADGATAQTIANALTTTIWPKLFGTLKMPTPLPDTGNAWAGPDGGLDIYLVPIADRGITTPFLTLGCQAAPPTTTQCDPCKATPVKIQINPSIDALLGTVAHEVMHASQYTYDVKKGCLTKGEYDFWMESTGQWAHDYVYPATQYEHVYAPVLQESMKQPLPSGPSSRVYGSYLFPFYLTHALDASRVADSWNQTVSAGCLEAIDSALSGDGGFEKVWPKFAVDLINTEPRTDLSTWDQIDTQTPYEQVKRLSTPLDDKQEVQIDAALAHLSARYLKFTLDTGTIGSLEYEGPALGEGSHLTALYKADGQWQVEDWTEPGKHRFCYNKTEQKVEELVLVYANSDFRDITATATPSAKPKLTAFKAPCTCAGVFGVKKFHGTFHFASSQSGSGMGFSEVSAASSGDFEFDVVMQSNSSTPRTSTGSATLTGSATVHDRSVATNAPDPDIVHTLDGDQLSSTVGASTVSLSISQSTTDPEVCTYALSVLLVIDAVDENAQSKASSGAMFVSNLPVGEFTGVIGDGRAVDIHISGADAQGQPIERYYAPPGFATSILYTLKYGPTETDPNKSNGVANATWTLTGTDPAP